MKKLEKIRGTDTHKTRKSSASDIEVGSDSGCGHSRGTAWLQAEDSG